MKTFRRIIASLMICALLVGSIGLLLLNNDRGEGIVIVSEEGTPFQDPDPIKH